MKTFIFSGKSDPAVAHKLLTQFLIKESKGNFLYLRMTLDLIDQGDIVPKSAGFKVVPINLNQVMIKLGLGVEIFSLCFEHVKSFTALQIHGISCER